MAVTVATSSPCAKSKRGVVIYDQLDARIISSGCNRQPEPFRCIDTPQCRTECAKLCSHAEQRAIIAALVNRDRPRMDRLDLLHVKVRDGQLVADPDDRPSCWQCSRMIVEVGLAGVWLYEDRDASTPDDFSRWLGGKPERERKPQLGWHYYTATEFHRETQINCGLPNTLRSTT